MLLDTEQPRQRTHAKLPRLRGMYIIIAMGFDELFTRIGADIAAKWSTYDYNFSEFDKIAEEMLCRHAPADHVDYDTLIHWANFEGGDQRVQTVFSDAGFPIYIHQGDGPRFVIEILTWLRGSNAIHDHVFAGAFQVLQGGSLQTYYEFGSEHQLHEHLEIGTLTATKSERLRQGTTRRILPGRGLIHRLYHIESPSLTAVVRTAHPNYTTPHIYLEHGAAYGMRGGDTLDENGRLKSLETVFRVMSLHGSVDLWGTYKDKLSELDAYQAFRFLLARSREPQYPGDIPRLIERRFGEHAEQIGRVLNHVNYISTITAARQYLTIDDHRYFIGLLASFEQRDTIYEFVEQYSQAPAVPTLRSWITELANTPGFLAIDDSVADVIELILSSQSENDFFTNVREEYGKDELEENRESINAIVEAMRDSVFSRLLWSQN